VLQKRDCSRAVTVLGGPHQLSALRAAGVGERVGACRSRRRVEARGQAPALPRHVDVEAAGDVEEAILRLRPAEVVVLDDEIAEVAVIDAVERLGDVDAQRLAEQLDLDALAEAELLPVRTPRRTRERAGGERRQRDQPRGAS